MFTVTAFTHFVSGLAAIHGMKHRVPPPPPAVARNRKNDDRAMVHGRIAR